VVIEAGQLVALQTSRAFAGDPGRIVALGGGLQQQREASSDLGERHRGRPFFFPDGFLG
jgi:hypothetical protein